MPRRDDQRLPDMALEPARARVVVNTDRRGSVIRIWYCPREVFLAVPACLIGLERLPPCIRNSHDRD